MHTRSKSGIVVPKKHFNLSHPFLSPLYPLIIEVLSRILIGTIPCERSLMR
jgi:hypothetical protein